MGNTDLYKMHLNMCNKLAYCFIVNTVFLLCLIIFENVAFNIKHISFQTSVNEAQFSERGELLRCKELNRHVKDAHCVCK